MINALSIDLEYWYSATLVRRYVPLEKDDHVVEAMTPLMELLEEYNTRATFFVLGAVAEKYPQLVKAILEKGHEVASHAYSHRTLQEMGREGFEEEIRRSVALLSSITGERPIGFRAPNCSLDNSTRWALGILRDYGFKYDCSVFPVKTMLYGVSRAPLHPYRPRAEDITGEDKGGAIIEFPVSVLKLGVNIPVGGGFYLRALPSWFIKFAIRRINKERPAIIYLHPWETYPGTPRMRNMPLFSKFVTYYGIRRALGKLEDLLNAFEFKPVREVLGIGHG